MYSPSRKDKLCYQKEHHLEKDQYKKGKERLPSGSEVDVTRFADGTSRVYWGGPCGSSCYDANGEEC